MVKSRRKYCTYCGAFIPVFAEECLLCGKKIEPIKRRGKKDSEDKGSELQGRG